MQNLTIGKKIEDYPGNIQGLKPQASQMALELMEIIVKTSNIRYFLLYVIYASMQTWGKLQHANGSLSLSQ